MQCARNAARAAVVAVAMALVTTSAAATVVTIDFETEDDFTTPLVNGQDISTPPEFGVLFSISDAGTDHLGPAIFDSTPAGPNASGPDVDLLVGLGNILILQDPDHPAQTVPGIFDIPDDDRDGGTIFFDFITHVELLSVDLVDINGSGQQVLLTLLDGSGLTRAYSIPGHWTNDVTQAPEGWDTLDLTILTPQTGEGGATATATEDAGFDPTDAVRVTFEFLGSGGIDNLRFDIECVVDEDCGDGIDCTVDACVDNECVYTPVDAWCDNGMFCDGEEICDPELGCVDGPNPDCSDDVECTVDACDETSDQCVHVPVDAYCDNGDFCDGEEVCDPELGCVDGPDPDCDDEIECTQDSCDEEGDQCVHVPDDTYCDNGDFCDGEEVCDPELGCVDGPDPDCDDEIECTQDSCDEEGNQCVHVPDDTYCDNGDFCDGEEVCDPELGCVDGPDPDCDDGIECTEDSCDEEDDQCVHVPDDTLCDDDNVCTDDACDPQSGCVFVPNDLNNCSDGLFCNGFELCIDGECQAGPYPCPPDAVVCTVEGCDEDTNHCVSFADDSLCDDGDACTDDICTYSGCIHIDVGCGACCLPDGTCVNDVVPSHCLGMGGGGAFVGPGTMCFGDSDGDGIDELCEPRESIPTVSEWGLVILTLLLATAAKLRFRREQTMVDG